jgi:hypothetical protein
MPFVATRRSLLSRRAAAGPEGAKYTVTTTGAATHTIYSFGVVASQTCTVHWGDGETNDYTGTAQRTHNYAAAGVWNVTITNPTAVRTFQMADNKVTLNSADIAVMSGVTSFTAAILKAGTFDSADVSAWRPSIFRLYSMPSGYAGTFDSADVSAWRPTTFHLYIMPSGYAGTFDSADVSAWRPTDFHLYSMPSGYAGTFDSADVSAWRPTTFYLNIMPSGYAGTFDSADVSAWRPTTFHLYIMPSATFALTAGGGFANWTTTTDFRVYSNGLSSAVVDDILYELYQASATPRTATGGAIYIHGTNAAPTGTFQAAAGAVDGDTAGKEVAHELKNDGQAVGFNVWTTVSYTA